MTLRMECDVTSIVDYFARKLRAHEMQHNFFHTLRGEILLAMLRVFLERHGH